MRRLPVIPAAACSLPRPADRLQCGQLSLARRRGETLKKTGERVSFRASSRLIAVVAALVGAGLLSGCGSGSDQLGSFGTPIEAGGHGAALPVSDEFGVDNARELQARISSAAFHKALEKYNCGDAIPE